MPQTTQNYANHVRYHAPYHFFLTPVLTIYLGWTIAKLGKAPTWDNLFSLLIAISLIVLMALIRIYALRVQDRIIRLEERLRYQQVLTPELAAKASQMPTRFIVALRFASDQELPGLVQRVLAGEFTKGAEAKRAIQSWRADYLRV